MSNGRMSNKAAASEDSWSDGLNKLVSSTSSILAIGAIAGAVYGILLLRIYFESESLHGMTLQMQVGASIIGSVCLVILISLSIMISIPAYSNDKLRNFLSYYDDPFRRFCKKIDIYMSVNGPTAFAILAILDFSLKDSEPLFTVFLCLMFAIALIRLWENWHEAKEIGIGFFSRILEGFNVNLVFYLGIFIVFALIDNILPTEISKFLPYWVYILLIILIQVVLSTFNSNNRQFLVLVWFFALVLNSLIIANGNSIVAGIISFNKLGGYRGSFSLNSEAFAMLPAIFKEVESATDSTKGPGITKPVCIILRMGDMVYIRPTEAYEEDCRTRSNNGQSNTTVDISYAFKENQIIDVRINAAKKNRI